ncbi:ribose/galactose ABC transporter permease [Mesoplasma lactucae ATCC 49193]|uniref:ABC transporter permease n=1 Tax=Mesoplasma lactucae ATCC 49193 TaxID=81460 RepID=A0A291ISD5_9MOLU|nr:ABC transporter permease [Mesoplasma lactucae]ATG97626.1 ABC transporter permease [Mesoplasma lactucae ATCC 49193]ATZ19913.1 ribose/galactose ABC transporter permease [Mesoplasma lactucae ATCC 49193]
MLSFFDYALALCGILLLAALSGYVSERAGVVNIGIEGMMSIGALVTAILGSVINKNGGHNLSQIWIVIVGGVVGAIFALLHGFASITLKSNQVISGTALNILAAGIAMFFATSGFFGPNATDIPTNFKPMYVDSKHVLPVWLIVVLAITILLFIFFTFTKFGMRYKMVGENPNAVDAAGISVVKYRYIAVLLSGFLAGLAGGIMICTIVGGWIFGGTTFGLGFLGLAILIFGQWNIIYITIGSIAFAFLYTLGNQLGTLTTNESLKANAAAFKMLPYILTIVVMVIFSKWSHAPAADGEPFDKAKR